ncbi:MAG TPA: hypothetical protein VMV21_19810, partial [Vicinamibacteria bacterium]|nr:hypothetical protein [Vicinamibacteria bacterium]
MLMLLVLLVAGPKPPRTAASLPTEATAQSTGRDEHRDCVDDRVQLTERIEGNERALVIAATGLLEATVSVKVDLKNMDSSVALPLTLDWDPQSPPEIIRLRPRDPHLPWSYQSSLSWRPGRRRTVNIRDFAFALPYPERSLYEVIQGRLGSMTHQRGSGSEEAIDWALPL